jgi:Carbon monoxide dehydrogenase subunit alpha N-terminal domain
MHEPLFAACLRGAAAVLSLTRTTLDAAAARRGNDAPLAYPDTAYELPVVFGLTDLRVATLADAGRCSSWRERS